jgi:hypothetical protein
MSSVPNPLRAKGLIGLTLGFGVLTAGLALAQGRPSPLRRPLHLPQLGPGRRCPVSPSHPAPWASQAFNGRGPVYLVGVAGTQGGTLAIDFSAPDKSGWYGQKTPWAIKRSYNGPILIRGGRIDQPGKARFAYGSGQHLRELYWKSGANQALPPDPNFRFLASETLVRRPGCYAYQIDGTSFSQNIVVRVPR